VIAAAVLAAEGRLQLPLVVGIAATAAIAGDNAGYLIGRRGGRRLLTRAGRWRVQRGRLLASVEAFFGRHGAKAVFLARWAPGLRVTGAVFAGAARMPWRRFLVWNSVGGIVWATSVALAGYLLGKAASAIVGAAGFAVVGLVVVAATVILMRQRRSRGRAGSRSSSAEGEAPVELIGPPVDRTYER
jgi:membrane protein DedA with SNARE-associated domain